MNYTVGNQEMLAIVISCRNLRQCFESARYPVMVLTEHHNLQRCAHGQMVDGRKGPGTQRVVIVIVVVAVGPKRTMATNT